MKKTKLISLVLTGAMVLSLTACGGSNSKTAATTTDETQAATEAANSETTSAAESTGDTGRTVHARHRSFRQNLQKLALMLRYLRMNGELFWIP